MHPFEADPNHIYYPRQRVKAGYVKAIVVGAAIGLAGLAYFKGLPLIREIMAESAQKDTKTQKNHSNGADVPRHESRSRTYFRIPKECVPYFREMKKEGISRDLRILTAKVVYIESKFDPDARGSAGDVSYGQLTRINLEDTIEKALSNPSSEGGRLVMPYLRGLPIRTRTGYLGHGLKSYFTRRNVVNRMHNLVADNGRANLRFTASTLFYGGKSIDRVCRKVRLKPSPDMIDAHHNSPNRTIKSIAKYRKQWRKSPILASITAERNRQFNRLVLLN